MKKIIALGTALSLVVGALPALAANTVTVSVNNSATVTNTVSASASTGNNTASGSSARNHSSDGNVADAGGANHAGNGGNMVSGGEGGQIQTGNASATSDLTNTINSARIEVTATPWEVDGATATIANGISLTNSIGAVAATDGNVVTGSRARNTSSDGSIHDAGGANQNGNGGNTVNGGNGGVVITGNSTSHTSVLNVLNRSITRITK
jgi:hypothetical protein